MDELVAAVAALVEMGFLEVTINLYKATLFVENQVFPEESVTYRKLIEELLDRGISAVTFSEGFAREDATALVALLAEEKIRDIDAARIFLEQQGVESRLGRRDDHPRETRTRSRARRRTRPAHARSTTPAWRRCNDVETQVEARARSSRSRRFRAW